MLQIFRLVICSEKRNNAIEYVDLIHAVFCDEISHRIRQTLIEYVICIDTRVDTE